MNKSCFIFFYIEEYAEFVPFSGALVGGAWPRLTHLDPAMKAMAPRPRLISKCVFLLNLKNDGYTDYFKKVHANSLLHGQII